jgi:hypothetical protein
MNIAPVENDPWSASNVFRGYGLVSVSDTRVTSIVAAFNGRVRVYDLASNPGERALFVNTLDEPFSEERFEELSTMSDDVLMRLPIDAETFSKLI